MSDNLVTHDKSLIRANINGETAKMPWKDLQRFFASGSTLFVSSELDLVDVAYSIHTDDVEQVRNWKESGTLGDVSIDQAKGWFEKDSELWTVVVNPWILVQEISTL
ncbi:MAG: hypothetical protein ACI845_000074 [Gammaproteobacteria bacterium]|jgi:hypothetical protein